MRQIRLVPCSAMPEYSAPEFGCQQVNCPNAVPIPVTVDSTPSATALFAVSKKLLDFVFNGPNMPMAELGLVSNCRGSRDSIRRFACRFCLRSLTPKLNLEAMASCCGVNSAAKTSTSPPPRCLIYPLQSPNEILLSVSMSQRTCTHSQAETLSVLCQNATE